MKITMKEQRVKRQRKEIVFIYDVRKNFKKSKFRNPTHPLPLSPLSKNIKFWSMHTLLPDVLNWHSKSPHPGQFRNFLENFNNEINIVPQSFSFANAQSIYYSHISNKIDRKPSPLCERLMQLECFHYRTTIQE